MSDPPVLWPVETSWMELAVHVSFAVDVDVNTMLVPVVTEDEGVVTETSDMVHALSASASGENKSSAEMNADKKKIFFRI